MTGVVRAVSNLRQSLIKHKLPKLLKDVKFVQEVAMQNSGFAYMIAKRMNHLQAQRAAATSWKKRRARINTISPGVIAAIRTGEYQLG